MQKEITLWDRLVSILLGVRAWTVSLYLTDVQTHHQLQNGMPVLISVFIYFYIRAWTVSPCLTDAQTQTQHQLQNGMHVPLF